MSQPHSRRPRSDTGNEPSGEPVGLKTTRWHVFWCLAREFVCLAPEPMCLAREFVCLAREFLCLAQEFVCLAQEFVCLAQEPMCLAQEFLCLAQEPMCLAREPMWSSGELFSLFIAVSLKRCGDRGSPGFFIPGAGGSTCVSGSQSHYLLYFGESAPFILTRGDSPPDDGGAGFPCVWGLAERV